MENFNPFTPIYEQLDRIESMVLELKHRLDERQSARHSVGNIDLAVRLTGYAKSTIYKLVCERRIPHSKYGGKLFFDEKAILAWIKGNERPIIERR